MLKRLALLLTIASLAHAAPAGAASPLLDLRGCLLSVQVLEDDLARVQPAMVPPTYRPLGWIPGRPFLALWSARCDAVSVAGRPARAASLAIAAFYIDDPGRSGGDELPLELPNLWAHYLHAAWTDDQTLARALRKAGFPTRHVEGMSFRRTTAADLAPLPVRPLMDAAVEVPGQWRSMTHAFVPHDQEHSHLNTFRRDGAKGTSVLELRIPLAVDRFCEGRIGEECGYVQAAPGTAAEDFIGGTRRPLVAGVDHDPIRRAVALTYRVP